MNRVDKRHILMKHRSKVYRRRALTNIQSIAIHHSATLGGSAEAFAKYHVGNLNWPGIGYHYVVAKDGTISWCHDLDVVSYHVGNSNGSSVGICMVGDFRTERLEEKQRSAAINLIRKLMQEFRIPLGNIRGHNEFPGYSAKSCPAINMEAFRNELKSTLASHEVIHAHGNSRTVLSKGDRGLDVKIIQQALHLTIDGIYGPATTRAVRKFQQKEGLKVDGIVGPETWKRLLK